MKQQPIGVFDSGYGGLTVLKEITAKLPRYDYIYLGDNARSPYGTRSFETVYEYTLQCVKWFFNQGCPLVILACNTASAKALRSIQQNDLPKIDSSKRVLGVIRPTTEVIGQFTKTGNVGILATNGTVISNSYPIEVGKFYPNLNVFQEPAPCGCHW
jgi:glutamate racemase